MTAFHFIYSFKSPFFNSVLHALDHNLSAYQMLTIPGPHKQQGTCSRCTLSFFVEFSSSTRQKILDSILTLARCKPQVYSVETRAYYKLRILSYINILYQAAPSSPFKQLKINSWEVNTGLHWRCC